jgi:hypothetical protein
MSPTSESFFEVQTDALELNAYEAVLADKALQLLHDIQVARGSIAAITHLSEDTRKLLAAIEEKAAELHAVIEGVKKNANPPSE